jgi:hypothetical protein
MGFGINRLRMFSLRPPAQSALQGDRNDRAIPPKLEKDEVAAIKATSIAVPANHLAMMPHPREVAEVIEQAAAKANGTGK